MDELKTNPAPENAPPGAGFVCDRAESALILPSLLVGFAFIRLVWMRGYGVAVPAFVALCYAVTFLYARLAGIPRRSREALPWHGLTAALTLPFLLRDGSDGRLTLTLMALILSMAFAFYSELGARRFALREAGFAADAWNACVTAPFANLGAIFGTGAALSRKGRSQSVMLVLAGMLLGLPLLLVLTLLFVSADAAFEGLMDMVELQFFDTLPEYLGSFLFGIPVAMAAFGILYGCRYKKRIHAVTAIPFEKTRRVPATLALGMLLPTAALCLTYLGSQLAYFFSAFSGLLPQGFTYAEYARRGFFELCAIVVILLGLVTAIGLFLDAATPAMQRFRQLISAFFCLFGVLLTATALSKMALYIRTYGVTPLRLMTTLFMLALGAAIIVILLRLFLPRLCWVRAIALIVLAAALVVSYCDMDALSLQVNYALGQRHGLDYVEGDHFGDTSRTLAGFSFEELVTMSDGTVPFLREIAASGDPETAALAKRVLEERWMYRSGKDAADPWLWNLTRGQ